MMNTKILMRILGPATLGGGLWLKATSGC